MSDNNETKPSWESLVIEIKHKSTNSKTHNICRRPIGIVSSCNDFSAVNRNKKRKRPPDEFHLANSSMITDHKIIVDEFNKYFVGIGGSVGNNQSNIMKYNE